MFKIVYDMSTGLTTQVDLTAEEIAALPLPDTSAEIKAQIANIEAANPITHRNLRDLSMTVAQIAAAVTGTDASVNPAVQQILALEAQISALRAQL